MSKDAITPVGITEIFGRKSDLHRALDGLRMPTSEPFQGETLLADGWQYEDLPRMAPEYFEKFIEIVGPENIRWLTLADYGDTDRGQCFISPAGIQRLRDYQINKDKPA